jgi:enoyl-CoA hydratase/carnithine racemase
MSVHVERDGTLVRLRLDKARGNAIDAELVEALIPQIDDLGRDDSVRGVMLCSAHPKVFCPGLDLVALGEYDRDGLERFVLRFAEMVWALYGLWKPVVAAVGGHAVAGGCIIALTADERVLVRGAQIGLNEVKIGVPLPWSVTVLLRASVSPAALTAVALDGRNFSDDEALGIGLAHAVLEADGFEAACLARLARLAEKDPIGVTTTKRYLREGALAEMKAHEATRLRDFIEAWLSPATTERRRQIVASLKK